MLLISVPRLLKVIDTLTIGSTCYQFGFRTYYSSHPLIALSKAITPILHVSTKASYMKILLTSVSFGGREKALEQKAKEGIATATETATQAADKVKEVVGTK